jgi:hypothetical protein
MKGKYGYFALAFFIGGFFVVGAAPAQATDKFFNFGGSNATQNGTESNPYTTTAQFDANISAGDRAYVTGTLTTAWTITKIGTSSAPVTIARWSGQPTLTVSSSSGSGIAFNGAQYVNMSDVSTTSSSAYGMYILNSSNITLSTITATSTAGSGLFISNGDNLTMSSITVSSSLGTGIVITEGSINGTLSSSTISNTGTNAYGVFIGKEFASTTGANTGWVFDGLTISNVGSAAFDCSASSNNLTLKNSTISGGTGTNGHGINITQCDTVTLTNNTTSSNAKNGVNITTVNGITITGSTSHTNTQHGFSLSGITTGTLSSNTAYSNTQNGISMSSSTSTNVTISGNTTYSNTQNGIVATAAGTGLIVNGNKSYNHTSSSQSSGFGYSIASTAPTVTNNISYGNRVGILIAGNSSSVANPVIRNNTVYNSSSVALTFVESGQNTITGVTQQNNTFTTGTNGAIFSYGGGDGPTWTTSDYNNFQLVGSSAVMITGSSTLAQWQTLTSQDANSLSADPVFTSTTSGSEDFRLQNTSTLIDAGHPTVTSPTTDYGGTARPYGASGRLDIGAWENITFLVSTNVSMSGVAAYDTTNGHVVTLTITDNTNSTGTKYGVTTDGGTTWLNGSGTTSSTPTYSTSKTWTRTGLTGATAYSHQVRIVGSSERTYLALLTAVSVTTAPAAPSGLTLTAPSTTTLGVSWTAPSGTITSYTVSYGTTSSADSTTATGITGTSTTLSSLSAGTIYYVKVRAHNATGAGPYTSTTTRATPPETLTPPKATEGTLWPTKATVTWPAVTGAASYRISYGTNTSGDNIGTVNVDTSGKITARFAASGVSTLLTGLMPSTTYYWKVAALTSDGVGAYSSVSSFTTPAAVLGLVVTPDRIANSNVRVLDAAGKQITSFFAYGTFHVKVKAITADLNGDGTLEIITTTQNPGATAHIRIFDSSGNFKANLYPFGTTLKGGADIATGDFDADGVSELAVIPLGDTATSNLRVYDYGSSLTTAPSVLAWRFAFDTGFRKGARVYAGDVNGDRKSDLVVVPRNTHPNVQVFTYNATTKKLDSLGYVFPYGKALPSSAHLALGDVDGNGTEDLIMVPYAGNANIQVYGYSAAENQSGVRRAFQRLAWTTGFSAATRGGFEVAAGDMDGNGKAEIVLAPQKGLAGQIQTFSYSSGTLSLLETMSPYGSSYRGGVHIAMFDIDQDQKAELMMSSADGYSANTRIYSYGSRLEQNITTLGWNLDQWFYAFASTSRIGAQLFK